MEIESFLEESLLVNASMSGVTSIILLFGVDIVLVLIHVHIRIEKCRFFIDSGSLSFA